MAGRRIFAIWPGAGATQGISLIEVGPFESPENHGFHNPRERLDPDDRMAGPKPAPWHWRRIWIGERQELGPHSDLDPLTMRLYERRPDPDAHFKRRYSPIARRLAVMQARIEELEARLDEMEKRAVVSIEPGGQRARR